MPGEVPLHVGQAPKVESTDRALDSGWYERLVALGRDDKDVPDSLAGEKESREVQKQLFLRGEIRNPHLETPFIDPEKLQIKEEELLQLKSDILNTEENELVREVYRWKINERVASIRMLRAAHEGKMRTFKRYAEFIYGRPSAEIFAYTVDSVRSRAEACREGSSQELSDAAGSLLDAIPLTGEPFNDHGVEHSTFLLAKHNVDDELGDILRIESFEGKLSGRDLLRVFQDALDILGMSEERGGTWRVVLDEETDARVISVDQMNVEVRVPVSAKLSHTELISWLAHEIGTHVLRRRNGERTKLKLLGIGLDRYEGGEEGVATMRGQVASSKSLDDFAGLRYHLVASLALGLDGRPRDFRDTFEIMEKYHVFNYLSKGKELEKAERMARNLAYSDCVRLYRGTDCEAGVILPKDIAYREANIGVYELIGTDEGQAEMMRFSIGKYDPMNPRHIWILDQLGVTEQDLVELDNEQA